MQSSVHAPAAEFSRRIQVGCQVANRLCGQCLPGSLPGSLSIRYGAKSSAEDAVAIAHALKPSIRSFPALYSQNVVAPLLPQCPLLHSISSVILWFHFGVPVRATLRAGAGRGYSWFRFRPSKYPPVVSEYRPSPVVELLHFQLLPVIFPWKDSNLLPPWMISIHLRIFPLTAAPLACTSPASHWTYSRFAEELSAGCFPSAQTISRPLADL